LQLLSQLRVALDYLLLDYGLGSLSLQ